MSSLNYKKREDRWSFIVFKRRQKKIFDSKMTNHHKKKNDYKKRGQSRKIKYEKKLRKYRDHRRILLSDKTMMPSLHWAALISFFINTGLFSPKSLGCIIKKLNVWHLLIIGLMRILRLSTSKHIRVVPAAS